MNDHQLNVQNIPKNEFREIRSVFKSPDDHVLVSFDFAALEARVIAMASKDPQFCSEIWIGGDEGDTHMKWSKRLLELFPCLLLDQEAYPKIDSFLTAMCKNTIFDDREKLISLRKRIKNLLVFPWFYGASKFSVSAAISTEYREVPEYVMNELYEEFWETYPMVKVWQRDQINFYNKYGYVKSLTGRRRRLPLKFNEVINHCIQSSASYDICLVAGDRLSKLGYELGKPQYQYFSNVHDELNFYIPYSTLVEDIETIAKEMVRPAYYFINVPLEVECKVGYNWFDLEDYWKFSTLDWWEYKNEEWIEK